MEPIDQAVVLVGGFGTRLGTLTRETPKPLLDVGGQPFVTHVLRAVAAAGITDILLLAGHLGDRVVELFDGARIGEATVRVRVEPAPLGTAGGLRHFAADLADRFFVLNGDSYFDVDLNQLHPALEAPAAIAAVALRAMDDCRRYGRVLTESADPNGPDGPHATPRVAAFLEKDATHVGGGLINSGLYAFDRAVLELIPGGIVSMEADVLPQLAGAGHLRAVIGDGYFIDIGLPESLATARATFPACLRRPAVFFDRDGVLNHDTGYTHRPDDLHFVDGAIAAVRRFNARGYRVFVVTNQAGIARGFYDEAAVRTFHAAMQRALRREGAHVDAFYYCPHHPEGSIAAYAGTCACRKPAPGMIDQALADWPIDRSHSLLIGDRSTDLDAAAAVGLPGHLFTGGDLDAFCTDLGLAL